MLVTLHRIKKLELEQAEKQVNDKLNESKQFQTMKKMMQSKTQQVTQVLSDFLFQIYGNGLRPSAKGHVTVDIYMQSCMLRCPTTGLYSKHTTPEASMEDKVISRRQEIQDMYKHFRLGCDTNNNLIFLLSNVIQVSFSFAFSITSQRMS